MHQCSPACVCVVSASRPRPTFVAISSRGSNRQQQQQSRGGSVYICMFIHPLRTSSGSAYTPLVPALPRLRPSLLLLLPEGLCVSAVTLRPYFSLVPAYLRASLGSSLGGATSPRLQEALKGASETPRAEAVGRLEQRRCLAAAYVYMTGGATYMVTAGSRR